jgi:hypothetical protein
MLQDKTFRPVQFKIPKYCSVERRPAGIRERVITNVMKTSHRDIPASGGILKQ